MIRVAAFTTGRQKPGSRFRVRQYVDSLKTHGIELSELFVGLGAYPVKSKWGRPFWAVGSVASRLPSVFQSYGYDLVLFQREMLSTFVTLEPVTRKPRILDVDDAIWLHARGSFASRLARICDSVICGNTFLADYFSRWNPNITILPTAVDTDRFLPLSSKPLKDKFIIGWSGGWEGVPDLQIAQPALRAILAHNPRARLRVISDRRPNLDLPSEQVEFVRWSPEVEVQALQTLDVGLMPLRDTPWSRGKCAYKMLLYMSCGVPVVVSPVGMTAEVCNLGPIGFAALTAEDWSGALEQLLNHPEQAAAMGQKGREVVVEHLSIRKLAPQLAGAILKVAGHTRHQLDNSNST